MKSRENRSSGIRFYRIKKFKRVDILFPKKISHKNKTPFLTIRKKLLPNKRGKSINSIGRRNSFNLVNSRRKFIHFHIVPPAGLEPATNGLTYHYSFHYQVNLFVVWTFSSPTTKRLGGDHKVSTPSHKGLGSGLPFYRVPRI